MNPDWTGRAIQCTMLHMPAPQSPSEGAGTATLTAPRPSPHPRPAVASTAVLGPGTAPRHEARPTGHRLLVAPNRWRVAGQVAAGVLVAATLLLGLVGWVALAAAVLG